MEHEFTNQHKYEARTLHSSEWEKVIEKASKAQEAKLHLFILSCLANTQSISIGTICAFKETKLETASDRSVGSTAIGTITTWVKSVTGEKKASFFDWHPISGEWTIGSYQMRALRKALGYKNSLPSPPKSYTE